MSKEEVKKILHDFIEHSCNEDMERDGTKQHLTVKAITFLETYNEKPEPISINDKLHIS